MSQEETTRTDGRQFTSAGHDGAIARIFMHGAGYSDEFLERTPVIGITASSSDLVPCNLNHGALVAAAKRGIIAAGGLPLEFPTISLGEPFVRPTTMLLRNLMAMDVEEMISASPIDGVLLIGGCDKTVPAQLMGAISAGKPAAQLVSGPRSEAHCLGKKMSIEDLWPLLDQRRAGTISEAEWLEVERGLNPTVGTCNVLGTASTMAAIAETLGFALPGSSLAEATSATRIILAERSGTRIVEATREGLRPQQLVTRASLENAYRMVAALGGSTNAIIHLAAIAGRAGIDLDFETIQEWLRSTPTVVHVKPSGEATLEELNQLGGVPAVVRSIEETLHTDSLAGTGRPWSHEIADTDPIAVAAADASILLLRGSLAPNGAVVKIGAAESRLRQHTGPAVVFRDVVDLHARIDDPDTGITADSVLVLQNSGPRGGPGMPEIGQLPIPVALLEAGVKDMVRISDARMSGTATGCCVLHVSPESAVGGPLSLVRDGDEIRLDASAGTLDLLVDEDTLAARAAAAGSSPSGATSPRRGYGALYAERVMQAEYGCDFDFLRGNDWSDR